jgi:hypothetical protein
MLLSNIKAHRSMRGIKVSRNILLAEINSASVVLCAVAVCRFEYQSSGKYVFGPSKLIKPPLVAFVVSKVPAKSASG